MIKKKIDDDKLGDRRRTDASQESTPWTHSKSTRLGGKSKFFVSILVVFHLFAVLAEPLRFFSRSPVKFAAEDARWLRLTTQPYSDFMYLSHGYSFFAPNPGPSHLLECEMNPTSNSDGKSQWTVSGGPVFWDANRTNSEQSSWRIYPDRKQDWPRLLYHRYFMLSEFYHTQFTPITLAEPEKLDKGILEQWTQDRQQYVQLQESIKSNLAQTTFQQNITLRRIEHILPSEYQVLVDRWKLTDPRLYVELPEGEAPVPQVESLRAP